MSKPKNYFSGTQLFWLTTLFNLAMPILLMVSPTVKAAKQDAWIAGILSTLVTACIMSLVIALGRLYPGMTFVEYTRKILGRWIGTAVSFLYVFMWNCVTIAAMRQMADFVVNTQYHKTPLVAVVFVTACCTFHMLSHASGIGSAGKIAGILGPVSLAISILLLVMSVLNFNLARLLPIDLTGQWKGILTGTVPGAAFMSQIVVLSMVLPHLQNQKKQSIGALLGVGLSGLVFVDANLMVVGTMGPVLPGKLLSPTFAMVSFISVGEFIQNLDALIVILWFMSAIIRVVVYQYGAVSGWVQLFNLRKRKTLNLILLPIQVVLAVLPPNQTAVSVDFVQKVIEPIVFPYFLVTGIFILYVIAACRMRRFI